MVSGCRFLLNLLGVIYRHVLLELVHVAERLAPLVLEVVLLLEVAHAQRRQLPRKQLTEFDLKNLSPMKIDAGAMRIAKNLAMAGRSAAPTGASEAEEMAQRSPADDDVAASSLLRLCARRGRAMCGASGAPPAQARRTLTDVGGSQASCCSWPCAWLRAPTRSSSRAP